ncbi:MULTISPECIES: glycoside hydrolase family 25 protein [Actinosynnema]|uniref:Glycoside hydrolase n=1 Tax=Actinosynnema pretiosum TaxID=42197 RepID=A0A290ZHA1_9PSEU|nr:glycoside hydrolase family 25 protein [Actinosynnema pretiosum]ATE58375.1 glycoside hydrolase [Actinosynnema pretiosum]MCP2098584.1 Lyzozyme M1 (1,4-beta-N-acetylmuramidase), GH25 family [Actinosynnema pretiosum]
MIYGVDVSAYQPGFDFAAARSEGFDFAFIKATEGSTWRSPNYHDQLARARSAGMLVAAYHYMRGDDVGGQLGNVRAVVGTDVPVVLDVEDGAGHLGTIRALVDRLRAAGYRSPLIYLPQWYWSGRMGSPDLSGLPPLWHSRYPDNVVRRKEQFALGGEYWPSFGGLRTEIAQFTSSLAVANYPNGRIDGNAYQGTRQELQDLLEGENMPSAQEIAHAVVDEIERRRYDTDGDGQPDRSIINNTIQGMWSAQGAEAAARDALAAAQRAEATGAGLQAAVTTLAEAVAAGRSDLTAAEIEAAVHRALTEGLVAVDLTINARPTEAAEVTGER